MGGKGKKHEEEVEDNHEDCSEGCEHDEDDEVRPI
jgi:hypothetical protein